MNLCSQSERTLPSRKIADARLQIMEAPVSPAARIISTTMPDVCFARLHLRDSLLNHINGDWDGQPFHWWNDRRNYFMINLHKSYAVKQRFQPATPGSAVRHGLAFHWWNDRRNYFMTNLYKSYAIKLRFQPATPGSAVRCLICIYTICLACLS